MTQKPQLLGPNVKLHHPHAYIHRPPSPPITEVVGGGEPPEDGGGRNSPGGGKIAFLPWCVFQHLTLLASSILLAETSRHILICVVLFSLQFVRTRTSTHNEHHRGIAQMGGFTTDYRGTAPCACAVAGRPREREGNDMLCPVSPAPWPAMR